MSKPPQDIIVDHILTCLAVKSLMRFKSVSKLWRSLISDLTFAKSHLERSKEVSSNKCRRLLLSTGTPQSVDFEAASDGDEDNAVQELEYPYVIIRCSPICYIGIVGSCNGLICLFVDYEKMVLWNPSTRASKELPKPSLYHNFDFFAGLGYDSSNGKQEIGSKKVHVIVSFDVAEEKFKEALPLPDHFDKVVSGMSRNFLCAFGECYGSYFEAWILDHKYDSNASIRRLFRFQG
ncbi:unnamed protein product [Dovyalis caffra]|uniref:F-box domain-containing protein n=1 Tax=Dovyalis caffra TaxID=77055 RepID=A0AAV1R7D8_9ROSI|nr:unnamed protein product [Dovyalis caffra]